VDAVVFSIDKEREEKVGEAMVDAFSVKTVCFQW